jgi:hypothetical protein
VSAPSPSGPPAETGRIALPAAVHTAACAAAAGDDLVVLINRPGEGRADALRVRPGGTVQALPPLPMVAAGVALCGGELLATGADAEGTPLVIGVAADGGISWRVSLPGPAPTRWPVPGCAPGPVVAWQTAAGVLEVADAGPGGIGAARSVPVGGPPLDVAVGGGAVWAAWTERSAVRVAAVRGGGVVTLDLPAEFPSDVAAGATAEGAAVAWTERRGAFLSRIGGGESRPPVALDLGPAAGGTLAVVAGPEPLVWAQRTETREGEAPGSVSTLVLPGREPARIDELVFAVAWWGRRVAAVCAGHVRLFDPGGA